MRHMDKENPHLSTDDLLGVPLNQIHVSVIVLIIVNIIFVIYIYDMIFSLVHLYINTNFDIYCIWTECPSKIILLKFIYMLFRFHLWNYILLFYISIYTYPNHLTPTLLVLACHFIVLWLLVVLLKGLALISLNGPYVWIRNTFSLVS